MTLSKLQPVVGRKDASALAAAITAAAAATSVAMQQAGWKEWARLLYALSKAGGSCSTDPSCMLTRVFQRACTQLDSLGVKDASGQSVSLLLLAAGNTGLNPKFMRPLAAAVAKELPSGNETWAISDPDQYACIMPLHAIC